MLSDNVVGVAGYFSKLAEVDVDGIGKGGIVDRETEDCFIVATCGRISAELCDRLMLSDRFGVVGDSSIGVEVDEDGIDNGYVVDGIGKGGVVDREKEECFIAATWEEISSVVCFGFILSDARQILRCLFK